MADISDFTDFVPGHYRKPQKNFKQFTPSCGTSLVRVQNLSPIALQTSELEGIVRRCPAADVVA